MIEIWFSVVGLMPSQEREIGAPLPHVMAPAVPRVGDTVVVPVVVPMAGYPRDEDGVTLYVRRVEWHPYLEESDPPAASLPHVYVVLGPTPSGGE